ncbi:hypothetical protein JB92DRAFT_3132855 [Gautieria morchelliformis]|nr:hypothetical protein JB92DRAFT_3132855 [Gautieria morchelliformis]
MSPLHKFDKSSRANLGRDKGQVAPHFVSDVPVAKDKFSNKSKVWPHPNFAAFENHEPDVIHELETRDLTWSKNRVSGMKRKKPVEDDDGPGPSKHYETLESIPVPAKGKEKTAKKTKVAKGASNKKSSSTATGSSRVRKTKRQPVPSARARGDHP